MDQSLKKILHKIWDEQQSFDVKFIQRYLGVQKKIDLDELRKEYRNWLGGDRVAFDKAHKLLSQKQRVIVGGYDFEFKPHNWIINTTGPNVTVYVDSCYVDPYGQVTLFGNDGGTYDIGEVISGEEFSTGEMGDVSSDVKYEIKEIVNDQLKDLLLKNCGVQFIPFPDIIYNSKPFDKPLREHILTELSEKYYDEDITKSFELVINKLLNKKYEWFDRIIINKLSYSKDSNYLGINAELFADEDWVGNQWMEHHYSTPIPSGTEDDPISLGDIISGELSKELQGHFKNVFKIITSEKKPKYMSWSWIDVIPVEMNDKKLQESIRRILREETEYGGGIFYHNSDYDIESFKPQLRNRKKSSYLFFSNEPNTFIDRKYTYEVKLKFNPNKIFNSFKFINDYGIKYTLEEHKDEVLDLFENNVDYFIDEWNRMGVDSVNEVMEYFINEGGEDGDMVGLLYYFITKWNDSWAVIETDKFLEFIESKGYYGFVTLEEGLTNIACNDFESIEIMSKRNMW